MFIVIIFVILRGYIENKKLIKGVSVYWKEFIIREKIGLIVLVRIL